MCKHTNTHTQDWWRWVEGKAPAMSGIIYLRAQAQTHPFNVTNETSNSTKEAYHSDKREHHLSARTAGDVPAAHPQPFFRFVFGSVYNFFIYFYFRSRQRACGASTNASVRRSLPFHSPISRASSTFMSSGSSKR